MPKIKNESKVKNTSFGFSQHTRIPAGAAACACAYFSQKEVKKMRYMVEWISLLAPRDLHGTAYMNTLPEANFLWRSLKEACKAARVKVFDPDTEEWISLNSFGEGS